MPGLDFRRAADLFLGSEKELALALGLEPQELQRLRQRPDAVTPDLTRRLGTVLQERGRGMLRVGEMLLESAGDATP
ncbi:MAG: hypothetical protein ACREL7_05855 [Longimicrobiales bacterium]